MNTFFRNWYVVISFTDFGPVFKYFQFSSSYVESKTDQKKLRKLCYVLIQILHKVLTQI
jgi:hypothetical protein